MTQRGINLNEMDCADVRGGRWAYTHLVSISAGVYKHHSGIRLRGLLPALFLPQVNKPQ